MKEEYVEFMKGLRFPINTLKNICFDENHPDEYLTDSAILAIDFDQLAKQYCEKNEIAKYPCTNDALYLSEEEWFFIEFKNGKIIDELSDDHASVVEIQEKILSSLGVLFSVTNRNPEFKQYFPFYQAEYSYTSQHVNYVLVYNPEKNKNVIGADKNGWKRQIKSGYFDEQIKYFAINYNEFFSKQKDIDKYEKKIEKAKMDVSKQNKTAEQLVAIDYFMKRRNDGFSDFIKDVSAKMQGKNNDIEFDLFAEVVLQEAEPSYQEGQLPLLVRFGLDKYAGSYVKNVFTYAGAGKQKDGTYNYGKSEFYLNFVKQYENK